jgi:cation transport ATPase
VGIELPPELRTEAARLEDTGATVVAAAVDGAPSGLIPVADQIKPSSAEAISELGKLGLQPVLLTGDNERAANTVARRVGIRSRSVAAPAVKSGRTSPGRSATTASRSRSRPALEPVGFTLSPAIGALSMSGSSMIVALNAISLRRLRLPD